MKTMNYHEYRSNQQIYEYLADARNEYKTYYSHVLSYATATKTEFEIIHI